MYSRPQEDISQHEELLSYREFWLEEHGCKCLKEWLQQMPNFKSAWPLRASQPWPPLVAGWCQGWEQFREVVTHLSDLLLEVKVLHFDITYKW